MKRNCLLILFVLLCLSSLAAPVDRNKDIYPLHRCEKALTDVIIHDIFSPPVASRIYAYANIAAHEALAAATEQRESLYGKLKSLPKVPKPEKKVVPSLAAVCAFMLTGEKLVFSEPLLHDSLQNILSYYKSMKISDEDFKSSMAYGEAVASVILNWAASDKYKETRKIRRYNYLKEEGKWIPTPPGYMAAVEPYWNQIRTLVLDSCNQFMPEKPLPFSKDTSSAFYKQAYEVYVAGKNLTKHQYDIASFWDCNPFFLNVEGHLNYATKKISPGGHWISIAGLVARNTGADLMKTSKAYTYTSIALFDAFISCWDEKFRSNVIRPETYINAYIDESWRPLLQTPPFPEYTSGHSVASTVASIVLSGLFGKDVSFDDNTEVEFGLPVRHFASFEEACKEAAISRLYGGIHYRAAIENGRKEGLLLGEYIAGRLLP